MNLEDNLQIGDQIEPKKGVFMPYWDHGATVVKIGMPMAYENDIPKHEGGDWVIISSHSGWLPRDKFKKSPQRTGGTNP